MRVFLAVAAAGVVLAGTSIVVLDTSGSQPALSTTHPVDAVTYATPVSGPVLPPLPANWPTTLELGAQDGLGGAVPLKEMAPFGFRYQYLAGGAGTGWTNWSPNGAFVTEYIQESISSGFRPVFTYYMIFQSSPGVAQGEVERIRTNLQNTATMTAYWNDLKLFFQRAGAFPGQLVTLHMEPDLWGFVQQRSSANSASTVSAQVAATGLGELAGLSNNLAGFAQAVLRLRDLYAPNVAVGYHLSVWGTGNDITYSDPPSATVEALAQRAAGFYNSLGADFDVIFAEFSDRDAGFKEHQYGDRGGSWWNADDFERNLNFLGTVVRETGKRVVLWQVPYGNTKMRAQNNTWNHYQDNRVEWLLDDPGRAHLQQYLAAGVIALLFGRGSDGVTCPCDANNDGITNPPPINGNTEMSLNADDDGGFFRLKSRAYYTEGATALP